MMTVTTEGLDAALAVIQAHEKDPGFKNALSSLRDAQSELSKREGGFAGKKAELQGLVQKAEGLNAATSRTSQMLAETASKLDAREKSLRTEERNLQERDSAVAKFRRDIEAREKALADIDVKLKRLASLESTLKKRELDLQQEKDRFEAWRSEKMAILAA